MSAVPAGYSGTPLPRKLGIKPDSRLALLGAPDGFEATLGELPPGVSARRSARGPLDASGLDTDLSEGVVRELGLTAGLVDNKVCAIDGTWSGLRFVYRLRDRR